MAQTFAQFLSGIGIRRKGANAGDYLVIEPAKDGQAAKYHLPVKKNGQPDRTLAGAAWAALHGGYRGQPYAGPNKAQAIAKLTALYKAQGWPLPTSQKALDTGASLSVVKQADGKWRWVLASSNSFEDDQKETVSQAALERDVARADKEQDYGPLLWWHLDGQRDKEGNPRPLVRIGQCDFNAIHNHSLLESGTFDDPRVAQAVKEHAHELQVSIGFIYPQTEPDAEGVFHHIRRYERSLLPAGAAANPLTAVPVVTKEGGDMGVMSEAKLKELETLVGKEPAAAAIQAMELAEQKAVEQRRAQKAKDDAKAAPDPDLDDAGGDDDPEIDPKTGKPKAKAQKDDTASQEQSMKALKELVRDSVREVMAEMQTTSQATAQKALEPIQAELKKAVENDAHILKTVGELQTAIKENADKVKALSGDLPPALLRRLAPAERDSNILTDDQLEALRQKGALPHVDDPNVKSFGSFLDFVTTGKSPAA